jgi:hypothetical protein
MSGTIRRLCQRKLRPLFACVKLLLPSGSYQDLPQFILKTVCIPPTDQASKSLVIIFLEPQLQPSSRAAGANGVTSRVGVQPYNRLFEVFALRLHLASGCSRAGQGSHGGSGRRLIHCMRANRQRTSTLRCLPIHELSNVLRFQRTRRTRT